MTVEIIGSASELVPAQQLIQNFMAEAAISMQSPLGGLINEEYNPYPEHAHFYASASSDASGHVSHAPSSSKRPW
ncbi:hypothetical protein CRYUN_Cryun01aG0164000 [Craigia yunnanensis]